MFKYILLSITASVLIANDYPELNGGRPGQAETITIVPIGYYQFESNFSPSDGSGGIMFRSGISSHLETRFSLDDLFTDSSSSPIGGLTTGVLMHISEDEGSLPGMGVALSISIPNANGLQMDASQIDLVFPFSKGITDNFGLDWHLGISSLDNSQLFSFASFFGYSITDALGSFFGMYGGSPMDEISDISLSMDGGFTYMLKDNIQVDLNGGIAISENGEDSFIDMGIVLRFPN